MLGHNRFDTLTNKQKRLVLHLLIDPSYDKAAKRMKITKRSVYRLVAGMKKRLKKYDQELSNRIIGG